MSRQEEEYLALFKQKSEDQLGWGDSEHWNNSDFDKLSELIFQETGVSLSISTLKRVWGKVKYDSVPTATTLNTLAKFSGYESWRGFCSQIHSSTPVTVKPELPAVKHSRSVKWIFLTLLILAGFTLVFFQTGFHHLSEAVVDRSKILFNSKVVTNELPNSVVFNYDVGDIKTDSAFIQQSWDPSRREQVSAKKHQHTSIYYFPGFFKAKLLIGHRVVKEHEIFIKTKGWMGIVQQQSVRGSKPFYLSSGDINYPDGRMEISAKMLSSKIGSAVFNDVWTVFCNAKEYPVDSGHFTFSATLQNTSAKEAAICQQMKINIITSDGVISLPLCAKGCISDIALRVGDTLIDGKDHDLSAFGYDFSKPAAVKLVVQRHKAIIFLNNRQIFTVPYNKPFGRIVNLMVIFEGAGMARDISIR